MNEIEGLVFFYQWCFTLCYCAYRSFVLSLYMFQLNPLRPMISTRQLMLLTQWNNELQRDASDLAFLVRTGTREISFFI